MLCRAVPSDGRSHAQCLTDAVYAVAVSPSGEMVLSGGGDDKGYVWSAATGEKILELTGLSRVPPCLCV